MSNNITTIPANIMVGGEYILVPRPEYERLTKKSARSLPTFVGYETVSWRRKKYQIPVYQLHGKAAEKSDKEVREALREYKEGKTKKIRSLADLDK